MTKPEIRQELSFLKKESDYGFRFQSNYTFTEFMKLPKVEMAAVLEDYSRWGHSSGDTLSSVLYVIEDILEQKKRSRKNG